MKIDIKKLKEYREKAGFTQKEMAKKIGVSDISYQYYELGIRNPKPKAVKRMELILNINLCIVYRENAEALIKSIICNMREAKILLGINEMGELKINDVIDKLKEIE